MSAPDPEAEASHRMGDRWQASQEQARLQDEVRGIRVSINLLIMAEKKRLARIDELQKTISRKTEEQ